MKFFVGITLLLFLTSCTRLVPKYKVGDCLKLTFPNDFGETVHKIKIEKVGKTQYLTTTEMVLDASVIDSLSEKINCKDY